MHHHCELAWSEFETYAINNPDIAYLNHRASQGDKMNVKKFSSRELRCQLIRKWGKESMKYHYARKRKRDAQDFEKRKRQVPLYRVYNCC